MLTTVDMRAVYSLLASVPPVPRLDPRQGFDITNDVVTQDLLHTNGFLMALSLMLRLVPMGLVFGALPCQSFVWLSSSTHDRHGLSPYGAQTSPFVMVGNTLCARLSLLILVGICRQCLWIVENPLRSIFTEMPAMLHLLHEKLKPLIVTWCLA